MCTDSCSLIFYGFYQSVSLKKEKANPKSKLSQGLRGWKWRKRGGKKIQGPFERLNLPVLWVWPTHSLTHTHQTDTSQLTHSTSLMNPSGSFNGDKFSRNPVIMFALLTPPQKSPDPSRSKKLWMLVQQGGKRERGGVVWLSDVVFTAYTAKNDKPRIVKVSFTGQICTKETRSNFRRSSGFIIGMADVYLGVLRRFLSPKRRSREEGRGGDIFCSVAGT